MISFDEKTGRLLRDLIRDHPLLCLAAQEAGPGRVFLVGGLIRDLLAGRSAAGRKDVDLAVSHGVMDLGRDLARKGRATMVVLSEEDGTVRLVGPGMEVDLTRFRAASLDEDLRARDFTVNAMALDLHLAQKGELRLVDPCGGLADLEQGLLRAAGPDSLAQDPLRVLRGYRLGAELGFSLEQATRDLIRESAPHLDRIAGERINAELTRLLQTPFSARWLRLMQEDGVLGAVFPEVAALEEVVQNRFHHLGGLDHTLEATAQAEQVLARGEPPWTREIASDEKRTLLVKLALLYHDTGKKDTSTPKPDGGIAFPGHDKLSRDLWLEAALRLRFSRDTAKAVAVLILAHMRPLSLLLAPAVTLRAARRLVLAAEGRLPELGLVCLADSLATQGPEKAPDAEERLLGLWDLLLETRDRLAVQSREPLLRGDDLIRELNLSPGPMVGRLLVGVEEARLAGEINTREEAMDWCRGELKTQTI